MQKEQQIPGRRLSAFSVLGSATGGFNIPLQAYLPAFYATVVGMNLQTVGFVFMISRLWSAFADPIVGWLSDQTGGRFGRRKPWIIGGGLVFLASIAAIFAPPANASPLYLGAWLLLLCLGWTATSTPLYAWGGELSSNPTERSRIQAYIQTGASVGIFLVLLMPAALDAMGNNDTTIRVHLMGGFVALALVAGVLLVTLLVREPPIAAKPAVIMNWKQSLGALAGDRTLWRILASDFFVTLGQGARGAVFVFFVTYYMGLAAASLLLLLQYAFGIFAAPLWLRISYRLGRVRTLVVAEFLQATGNLALLLVTPDRLWLLAVLVAFQGVCQGSGNLMLRAMIYDVADRHRASSGIERAGLFSSIFNVTTNAAFAVSVGIAFAVLGWLGFQPAAANDDNALRGLLLFFAIGPAIGHFLSIVVIRGIKISDTVKKPAT